MALDEDPVARVQQALASPDAAPLERVVAELERSLGAHPATYYAQAELARRRGELDRAAAFSTTAVSAIFQHRLATPGGEVGVLPLIDACLALPPQRLHAAYRYLQQMGRMLDRAGALGGLRPALPQLAARLATRTLAPMHIAAVFALLGFYDHCDEEWAGHVFEEFALPWLRAVAERGDFEAAVAIENGIYQSHVKRRESQAWFKATTGRWIPALAQAARRHAPADRAHRAWRRDAARRVAFFLHNASLAAHVIVLLETLQATEAVGRGPYEFTVFVFGGRNPAMEERFAACGVRVAYLDGDDQRRPFVARLEALGAALERDNFAVLFWVTLVAMMAVAFPRRMAPVQAWLAMKYHACEIDEIDARFAVENVVLTKAMEGHEWRTFGSAAASWRDPALEAPARELRAGFPPGAVVAASIGREEKLDSPAFLEAVCALLQRHPELHFVWTGRVQRPSIQGTFERAGVAGRTRFAGWVDTRLYAQAIDLFLDSFPFPCGFTLKEAMAAGKPAVMMSTPESLETGVPGAISPLVEGSGVAAPEARERLRAIFTGERDFDLYRCAGSPEEYVAMASALVADAGLRARVGGANRAFIEAFLSSPQEEARKFLAHLDAIFETIPTT